MRNIIDLYEASILDIEGTMIEGDDIVKSPKFVLDVKCKDIQQVADVVGKCVGQKIKVKKMTGKWYVDGYNLGSCIDVKGCPGFVIERIDSSRIDGRVDRKLYFAVWEGRLVCKLDLYYYRRKTNLLKVWKAEDIANPNNYSKIKNTLGVVGSGTKRHDWVYHWEEDTLWDWLTKSGFERFFDKI